MNPGEVHVWLVPVRPRAGWLAMLDEEERQRAAKLASTPAGDTFVTSRATQRLVGSHYLGIPPADIVTDRTCNHCDTGARHGRPRFRDAGIDYSVSHTEHWVIMAVTGSGLVGVDIEDLRAAPDPDGLARACLTSEERRHFDALPLAERAPWLVSAWTRKEAAMKLTGLGLRAPPKRLDVSGSVVATAVPRWPAAAVHLHDIHAPSGHLAALATTVPLREVRSATLDDLEILSARNRHSVCL
ncbi:4'-phosphopantetheinyl transferase family protein [Kutzneria kofuensis]|uniref:4'-phosphopantetheinyl transferase n=1 Tax=Kutzneria kofuensis TaxID=103725 RepID=A0A7W9NKL1_9PSEU|nr:4'-phosphopantetheinyl transferase superfamily protein [Kutzneria kofuensis]MBB5895794.1 4'-phosphopantetheinyl transferase [Kutzneria kofuensis]